MKLLKFFEANDILLLKKQNNLNRQTATVIECLRNHLEQ
jgi:hypothetical protein